MEKTYKENLNMWELAADQGHILHKAGSGEFPEMRRMMVKPSEVDLYEEVPVADIPPYTEAQYGTEVERLISERYSHGKEIEINREKVEKPERFAEYMAFVEQCKARAKEALSSACGEADCRE